MWGNWNEWGFGWSNREKSPVKSRDEGASKVTGCFAREPNNGCEGIGKGRVIGGTRDNPGRIMIATNRRGL